MAVFGVEFTVSHTLGPGLDPPHQNLVWPHHFPRKAVLVLPGVSSMHYPGAYHGFKFIRRRPQYWRVL
jgi:hypothetical protein